MALQHQEIPDQTVDAVHRLPCTERGALTRVVVRFNPDIVRWVSERQHFSYSPHETAEERARGAGEAVMVYRPRAFDVVDGWLLSWGDAFEVLEPPELRQRLDAIADRIAARHAPLPVPAAPRDAEEARPVAYPVGGL